MKKIFSIEWEPWMNLYEKDFEAILNRANLIGMNKFKVTEIPPDNLKEQAQAIKDGYFEQQPPPAPDECEIFNAGVDRMLEEIKGKPIKQESKLPEVEGWCVHTRREVTPYVDPEYYWKHCPICGKKVSHCFICKKRKD